MATAMLQTIHRDPQLFYWILFPIITVMILTGILRHYVTVLLASSPKKLDLPSIREARSLQRGVNFRQHAYVLSPSAFASRKNYLVSAFSAGAFLKNPDQKGAAPPNPMTDPAAMEGMMGMMKGNLTMIVPQTLIMGWINAFFSGFVVLKLPFALTPKFKSMLQSGVQTRDLDARWVSSISLYFICLFGLQAVFTYLLGSDNAASQMAQQQMAMGGGQQAGPALGGPGVDAEKIFKGEAENIEVLDHTYILEGVEERLLRSLKA